MTTLALSPTSSNNLQREAEAHPWFSFQPGKSPRQPRQDAVTLHGGGTGRPPGRRWMDGRICPTVHEGELADFTGTWADSQQQRTRLGMFPRELNIQEI